MANNVWLRALCVAVGLLGGTAGGQTTSTWLGGSGDWNDPSKWSGGVVPGGSLVTNIFIDGGKSAASVVNIDFLVLRFNSLTIDPSDTLRGRAEIKIEDDGGLFNHGFVLSEGSDFLTFEPTALNRILPVTNSGTIQAINGGLMSFTNTTISNTGTIHVGGESGIGFLNNTTVAGGTLSGSGESLFLIDTRPITSPPNSPPSSVVFDGVTLDSGVLVVHSPHEFESQANNGHNATLKGAVVNNGIWSLNGGGKRNQHVVILDSGVSLGGAGGIVMSPPGSGFSGPRFNIVRVSTGVATQEADHSVLGSGAIQFDVDSTLINKGSIVGDQTDPLVIERSSLHVSDNRVLVNEGVLAAINGGRLVLGEAIAVVNNGGTVEALDGSTVEVRSSVAGGSLVTEGSGVIKVMGPNGAPISMFLRDITLEAGSNIEFDSTVEIESSLINNTDVTQADRFTLVAAPGETDVVLTGTGTMRDAGFFTQGDARLINETGHTLRGSTEIRGHAVNKGTIIADGFSSIIAPVSGAGFVNEGTLRSDSFLILTGKVTNTGHAIEVADGEQLLLRNAQISGGAITTGGTGTVEVINLPITEGITSLTDVVVSAGIQFEMNTHDVSIAGTVTNHGDWALDSFSTPSDQAVLTVGTPSASNTITLTGNGTVTLMDNPYNELTFLVDPGDTEGTRTLVHGADHTIQGAGSFGLNTGGVVNHGAVIANVDNALTIDPNGLGFMNDGTLGATGVGGLVLHDGVFTNMAGGRVVAESSIALTGGSTLTNLMGGVVSGGGEIDASDGQFINQGTLGPGSSTGVLGFIGDYSQSGTGNIEIELAGSGGVAGSDFDQVTVTANALLDGGLDILLSGGFVPNYGDAFEVLIAGTRTGEFSVINGAFINEDMTLAPAYDHGGNAGLTLIAVIPGDADMDGVINGQDLLAWQANLFTNGGWAEGDFNLDGMVNGLDLLIWQSHLFASVGSVGGAVSLGADSAVPEPGAGAVLMGLGAWGVGRRRR